MDGADWAIEHMFSDLEAWIARYGDEADGSFLYWLLTPAIEAYKENDKEAFRRFAAACNCVKPMYLDAGPEYAGYRDILGSRRFDDYADYLIAYVRGDRAGLLSYDEFITRQTDVDPVVADQLSTVLCD